MYFCYLVMFSLMFVCFMASYRCTCHTTLLCLGEYTICRVWGGGDILACVYLLLFSCHNHPLLLVFRPRQTESGTRQWLCVCVRFHVFADHSVCVLTLFLDHSGLGG